VTDDPRRRLVVATALGLAGLIAYGAAFEPERRPPPPRPYPYPKGRASPTHLDPWPPCREACADESCRHHGPHLRKLRRRAERLAKSR
jgi:hypothetical protein